MTSHLETFDEVIARGFPLEQLEELAHPSEERIRRSPAGVAARLPQATGIPTARKSEGSLPAAERTAFQNAIVQMAAGGQYRQLILPHTDMSHNMHGQMGAVGLYRFLGWHRRYLLEFERQLQTVDATLRPGATNKLGVPYWRWQDPFPAWMAGFLPAKDP